jgi:site-specific DNA-methyltransferase (adenine-specific)
VSTNPFLGDCLEVMAGMDENSVDAVVTDPPYGLGFMGKRWDGMPPGPETAAAILRVLKPAHYLVAFGGTRTHHRLMVALEDAGFEIRDMLMWLYGSGFPKGKGNLKPAWEPIVLCRKPGKGVRELGIDECRIGTTEQLQGSTVRNDIRGGNFGAGHRPGPDIAPYEQSPSGRWPANLILDEEAGAMLDEQSGTLTSGALDRSRITAPNKTYGVAPQSRSGEYALNSGGASRFFYCPKASRSERNEGCEDLPAKMLRWSSGEQSPGTFQSEGTDKYARNHHPTVKPVDLMRWLVRLIAPEGGTVLDPFMGSGTTGVACVKEGRSFVGIEREAEYLAIAEARIDAAERQLSLPVGIEN